MKGFFFASKILVLSILDPFSASWPFSGVPYPSSRARRALGASESVVSGGGLV